MPATINSVAVSWELTEWQASTMFETGLISRSESVSSEYVCPMVRSVIRLREGRQVLIVVRRFQALGLVWAVSFLEGAYPRG